MALASATVKTETMLDEDNNEFSFLNIELIEYQEASQVITKSLTNGPHYQKVFNFCQFFY